VPDGSEPKLHHFVPRFHLARFADDRGRIWTFDKETERIFPAGPNSIAAERHFYKLPEFVGTEVDPLFLEKQFAHIEGEASNITSCWLRQLESNTKVEIPDVNREIMSNFLALQFFRTADAREILKLFSETTGNYPAGVIKAEARRLQAQLLCQLADKNGIVFDLSQRIRESIWIFARNTSSTQFMTSDTPVLLKTPDNRMWLKGPGIFQLGMYVVYAITPTVVLYCKERTHWKTLEQFDNTLSPVTFTPEMVDHENSGHAGMSARFVFSSVNAFEYVKKFLEEMKSTPQPFD
jgi:hypothetical protein